ncbi:unnamed protein product [Vicia faba]|uniref:G-patch domain-containing protein n=1 Tax=Vicia faba TaxID=3906 RepID=A0AAV0ZT77_VICFA|nr:unnamed protein product [Vicia faba]
MEEMLSSSTTTINSSNIGFQLLKKQGWKEGTGLGISEQGRLEPVETHVKNNKRGLGADKVKKKIVKPDHGADSSKGDNKQEDLSKKKTKALSKRMRKMQELEKKMQEKEFERAFFREFWPDNV